MHMPGQLLKCPWKQHVGRKEAILCFTYNSWLQLNKYMTDVSFKDFIRIQKSN